MKRNIQSIGNTMLSIISSTKVSKATPHKAVRTILRTIAMIQIQKYKQAKRKAL